MVRAFIRGGPANQRKRRMIAGAAAICALTFIAYVPAFNSGYVWDDDRNLTQSRIIRSPDGLGKIWRAAEKDILDYFPMTWTSFWIEYRIWGVERPWGFHATNILLHALGAIFLWRILAHLLQGRSASGAWLAAAIFAVHPANVASVAWITERKNTLSLLFFALSLLLYLRFEDGGRRMRYAASLICFLLALLSKNSVVFLPVALLLCAWWRRDRIARQDARRAAPFFALAILAGIIGLWFQTQRAQAGEIVRDDSILSRFLGAGAAVWFYAGKLVWPADLKTIYAQWSISSVSVLWYVPLVVILLFAGFCWKYRRGWGKPALFAAAYFVVALGPALGFFNIAFMMSSYVADWWQYLASIGVIALAACGIASASRNWTRGMRRIATAASAGILTALICFTWSYAKAYENQDALWRHTICRNPEAWLAYPGLANERCHRGRYESAISLYDMALRRIDSWAAKKPPNTIIGQILDNRGLANMAIGDYGAAMDCFRNALAIEGNAFLYSHMGLAYEDMGDWDNAFICFQRAVAGAPASATVWYNRARYYYGRMDFGKALSDLNEAIARDPFHAEGYYLRSQCRYNLGDLPGALKDANEAIQLGRPLSRQYADALKKAYGELKR